VTKRKPTIEHQQPAGRPTIDDVDAVRAEAIALLAGDRGLTDNLQIDLVSTLRMALDNHHARAQAGEKVDLGQLLAAEERLRSLLPAARAPADTKLSEHQRHQAAIAPVIKFVRSLHDQIAALQAENVTLRSAARSALAPAPAAITPTEADVVPPSEQADRDSGPKIGPDDRKSVVIDADAVDLRAGFSTDNSDQSWRAFSTDTDGVPLTVRGRKYWGPV
jgi:hypothetical protein